MRYKKVIKIFCLWGRDGQAFKFLFLLDELITLPLGSEGYHRGVEPGMGLTPSVKVLVN